MTMRILQKTAQNLTLFTPLFVSNLMAQQGEFWRLKPDLDGDSKVSTTVTWDEYTDTRATDFRFYIDESADGADVQMIQVPISFDEAGAPSLTEKELTDLSYNTVYELWLTAFRSDFNLESAESNRVQIGFFDKLPELAELRVSAVDINQTTGEITVTVGNNMEYLWPELHVGVTVIVQYSTDLETWVTAGEGKVPEEGTIDIVVDPAVANGPRLFFRVGFEDGVP